MTFLNTLPGFAVLTGPLWLIEGCRVKYQTGVYSPFFHIDNTGYKRVDARSGQVLEKWRGNGAGKECIRGDQLAKSDPVYFRGKRLFAGAANNSLSASVKGVP